MRSLAVDVLSKYIKFAPGDLLTLEKAFNVDIPKSSLQVPHTSGRSVSVGNVTIYPSTGIELFTKEGYPSIQLQQDGDAFFGANLGKPSETSLRIFSNRQYYNAETLGAGDVLLGDNTSGKPNILWDKSAGELNFRSGTDTKLYIDTAGDLILTGRIASSNYAKYVSGFEIDAETGDAEFNNAYIRGAITAVTFVKDNISAVCGTVGIFKSSSIVHTGFTTAAVSSTTTAEIDNDPSGDSLFALNDYVYVSFYNGTAVKAGYMKVTNVGANSGTYTTYTLETISSAIASTYIPEGTVIVDYGVTGDGRITLKSGTYTAINLSEFNSTGPSLTGVLQIGNLDGLVDVTTKTYGLVMGDITATSTNYLKATASGIVISAASGKVITDANGLSIIGDTSSYSDARSYKLQLSGGEVIGRYAGFDSGTAKMVEICANPGNVSGKHSTVYIRSRVGDTTHTSQVGLRADRYTNDATFLLNFDSSGNKYAYLTASLHVGSSSIPANNDDLIVDGCATLGGLRLTPTEVNIDSSGNLDVDYLTAVRIVHYDYPSGSGTTENVTNIVGGLNGQILILTSRYLYYNVTIVDGGNINLAGGADMTLTYGGANAQDTLMLICYNSQWHEISRSDNT